VRIVRTYGMTETCGGVVYDGRPLAGVSVKIGHDGVIHLRTPSLMERYRADDELTKRVLHGGWYRTGDVGTWDGRRLSVVGREDDAIVTGGEKVFPGEVEQTLMTHPRVRSARVFAEPDEEWGQRVVAAVAGDADEDALRSFLKDRLARHKVPARIVREEGP
jgi:O-succinylbenzoic acid--CoA ligase